MPMSAPITCHRDLYRYWQDKRGNRAMPSRADLDPVDIPWLLPHLSLVHKVSGRLYYRLVGTAIVQQHGRDLTGEPVGSYISGGAPEKFNTLQALGERVFSDACPV